MQQENVATRPFVVAFMGIPGAGKSTLCEWLRQRVPARLVSRDAIRTAMFDPCSFTVDEKQAAFDALLEAVRLNGRLGTASLIDGACFSRVGDLERVEEIATILRVPFIAVYCSCPVEEAQARVESDRRNTLHDALDRDSQLVARVAATFRPLPSNVLVVDTAGSVESAGSKILRHLSMVLEASV